MFLEEVGRLYKGDPTFDFIFHKLPKRYFIDAVKMRRDYYKKHNSELEELYESLQH